MVKRDRNTQTFREILDPNTDERTHTCIGSQAQMDENRKQQKK